MGIAIGALKGLQEPNSLTVACAILKPWVGQERAMPGLNTVAVATFAGQRLHVRICGFCLHGGLRPSCCRRGGPSYGVRTASRHMASGMAGEPSL